MGSSAQLYPLDTMER